MSTRLLRALPLALFALLAGCTTAADIGEACVDSGDCMADLACVTHPGTAMSVCMERCDPATTYICERGEWCADLTNVCLLGGSLPRGSSCLDRGLECTTGTVCIQFEVGVREECRTPCRTDGTDCDEGETCMQLGTSGNRGFCDAAP